jgi:uncharacterized cupredoxin-like copper-binding protein
VLLAGTGFLQGIAYLSGTSQGLAGATILLHKLDLPSIPDQSVTTDATGTYLFQNLPSGKYRLTETPPPGFVNDQSLPDSPLTPILGQTSSSIDVQLSDPSQLLLSYPSHNKEVLTTTNNGATHQSLVGQLNITVTEPDINFSTPLFPSFCVDYFRDIFTGEQNLPYSMEPLNLALAADPHITNPQNAGVIAYLYNHNGATFSTDPPSYVPVAEAAGFQLALWELLYESTGSYDVLTGSSFVHNLNSNSPEVQNATNFLNQVHGQNELAVYLNGLPTTGRSAGSQGLIAPESLNFTNAPGSITIVKDTNGVHDPDPNGTNVPLLAPGDPVTWTYLVSNNGNVGFPKANVVVTDNQTGVTPAPELSGGFVVGDTNQNNILDPGETWTYAASGTAVDLVTNSQGFTTVPGCDPDHTGNTMPAYENTGTVTITGTSLTATDISHYCNPPTPGIALVKDTNGVHDPDPNGANVPLLAPGDPVTWTYLVTNTGNVSFALANVVVTDNQTGVTPAPEMSGGFVVGDTNHNNLLDPGETWTYAASGTAVDLVTNSQGFTTVPGCDPDHTGDTMPAYENTGKVTITSSSLVATDISHYCNPPAPGIKLVKLTNGVHDPDPNGTNVVGLSPGASVTWTYQVTNDGNVAFAKANVVVTDDQKGLTPTPELSGGFVVGDTNQNNILDPGETWTFTASGTAVDLLINSQGFTTVPGCDPTHSGKTEPVYENTGKVAITGTSLVATDKSDYCNMMPQPGTLPLSVSGTVFVECDNDGVQQAGESGIPGVTVTLMGIDNLGHVVSMVTTTDTQGHYSFTLANPGTYVITEGATPGLIEGKNTAGTAGGSVSGDSISNIVLVAGQNATGYNFAELHPASLSGFVYFDLNHNGVFDSPDFGIAHVKITLNGTDDLGQSIHLTTVTDSNGAYSFDGLRPGTYEIVRAHPAIFHDFKNNVGSLGGTAGKDSISNIVVPPCADGVDYDFGELQSPTCKLRNLAINVGNLFFHFERTFQADPAAFAKVYPRMVPFLEAGQVPWGISPFPTATLAHFWVPTLGTKPIKIFPVKGLFSTAAHPRGPLHVASGNTSRGPATSAGSRHGQHALVGALPLHQARKK